MSEPFLLNLSLLRSRDPQATHLGHSRPGGPQRVVVEAPALVVAAAVVAIVAAIEAGVVGNVKGLVAEVVLRLDAVERFLKVGVIVVLTGHLLHQRVDEAVASRVVKELVRVARVELEKGTTSAREVGQRERGVGCHLLANVVHRAEAVEWEVDIDLLAEDAVLEVGHDGSGSVRAAVDGDARVVRRGDASGVVVHATTTPEEGAASVTLRVGVVEREVPTASERTVGQHGRGVRLPVHRDGARTVDEVAGRASGAHRNAGAGAARARQAGNRNRRPTSSGIDVGARTVGHEEEEALVGAGEGSGEAIGEDRVGDEGPDLGGRAVRTLHNLDGSVGGAVNLGEHGLTILHVADGRGKVGQVLEVVLATRVKEEARHVVELLPGGGINVVTIRGERLIDGARVADPGTLEDAQRRDEVRAIVADGNVVEGPRLEVSLHLDDLLLDGELVED